MTREDRFGVGDLSRISEDIANDLKGNRGPKFALG